MNNIDSDSEQAFMSLAEKPSAALHNAQSKPAALKAKLAKILAASGIKVQEKDTGPSHFTFGVDTLDNALRGNALETGLPRDALHEIHSAGKEDITSAAAMALLLAERCRDDGAAKPVLWISETGEARRQGRLYPPGLAELGIDPENIIHVDAPDSIAVLRAAADGVRSSAMGTVIAELAGKKPKGLDLTATRRLSLSAQKSGVLALLLRSGSDPDDPMPTAAFSRWEVSAAPSVPLEANAPGHPVFDLRLLRHRSGLYGLAARLEWNSEHKAFGEIFLEEQAARQRTDRQKTGAHTPDAGTFPAFPAVRAGHRGARAA